MSLDIHNLSLERGTRLLQQGLNFELASGEALWVQGPNGVGKSTLLETLCGFRNPHGGEIFWQGQPIHTIRDEYHEALDYLGHKNANNPNLTTRAALDFYAALYGSRKAASALETTSLTPRAEVRVRELSAGQQKRLALARILLRDTPLWILDEPSVSLDDAGVKLLVSLIKARLKAGAMVIYTSHIKLAIPAKSLNLSPLTSAQKAQTSADEFLGEGWSTLT